MGKADSYKKFLTDCPEAKIWIDIGLAPYAAKGLCKAGILDLEQLGKLNRDEVCAIWGIGELALRICEEALGRVLSSPRGYWKDREVPKPAIEIFLRERIETQEQLMAMQKGQILSLKGMKPTLLAQVEEALRVRFSFPLSYWTERGLRKKTAQTLNAAGILTLEQLAATSQADLERMLNTLEYRTVQVILRQAKGIL